MKKMCAKLDIYFWRQSFILLSGLLFSMGVGFMLAFPSILVPGLASEGIDATASEVNAIVASNGFAGVIGFLIQSPIMQKYGRKTAYIVLNVCLVIGWIIFYFATNTAYLFAARIIQGICVGGLFINAIVVSEYCHPKRRGYFMSLKKAAQSTGALICHLAGQYLTWKQVSLLAIAPPALAILTTLNWPESPSFLIMIGKFDLCERSYFYLNEENEESIKELSSMIAARNESLERKISENKSSVRNILEKFVKKDFLKPFVIVSLLALVIDGSGKYYLVSYIVQIMKSVCWDRCGYYEHIHFVLGADCLIIVALFVSCFVLKYFKRRTVLFNIGSTSVLVMFLVPCVQYYVSDSNQAVVSFLTAFLIVLHGFLVNVSVIPVCFTYFGELFPLEHRGVGFCASGIVLTCFYAVTMVLTPMLLQNAGLAGTYLTYGIFLVFCYNILYFVLPETKDKTLQDIENDMKDVKRYTDNTQMINSDLKMDNLQAA